MRTLILMVILTTASLLQGQHFKPQSMDVAYFGETLTHPGFKVGVQYPLKSWEKTKIKKGGIENGIQKSIVLSPSLGIFYHKNYQTGLFILPELGYTRKNKKGNFLTYALGAGYMRTFVPNVYDLNPNGEVIKKHKNYNYFIANYSIAFGKDLSVKKKIPMGIYLKPQLMYATPNYSKGIPYFAFEMGVNYWLTQHDSK